MDGSIHRGTWRLTIRGSGRVKGRVSVAFAGGRAAQLNR
jgi:hypothetical protein